MYQSRQFPVSESEFEALFPNEAACIDYLFHARWPDGFYCPSCREKDPEIHPVMRITCTHCGKQTSLTNDIIESTNMQLHDWLLALWWLSKRELGTMDIPRKLKLGSYRAAGGWMHQLRVVMALADHDPCHGVVEIGNGFVVPAARKVQPIQVIAAAERLFPSGSIGRIHIQVIDALTAGTVKEFVHKSLESGCTIVGPKLSPYQEAANYGEIYVLDSGQDCPVGIRSILSSFEVWLKNFNQRGGKSKYLQQYCDEFCFQHNIIIHEDRQSVFSSLLEGCFAGLTEPCPKFVST